MTNDRLLFGFPKPRGSRSNPMSMCRSMHGLRLPHRCYDLRAATGCVVPQYCRSLLFEGRAAPTMSGFPAIAAAISGKPGNSR